MGSSSARSTHCLECSESFTAADYRTKFCSRSCSASFNNRKHPKRVKAKQGKCPGCGEPLRGKVTKHRRCQSQLYVSSWLAGEISGTTKEGLSGTVRLYLLSQAGYKCSSCGWSGVNPVSKKSTLQVDHKDGDSSNNRPENLQVLCPNCHSLTPSYGALNKGKGRKTRHAVVV